ARVLFAAAPHRTCEKTCRRPRHSLEIPSTGLVWGSLALHAAVLEWNRPSLNHCSALTALSFLPPPPKSWFPGNDDPPDVIFGGPVGKMILPADYFEPLAANVGFDKIRGDVVTLRLNGTDFVCLRSGSVVDNDQASAGFERPKQMSQDGLCIRQFVIRVDNKHGVHAFHRQ